MTKLNFKNQLLHHFDSVIVITLSKSVT